MIKKNITITINCYYTKHWLKPKYLTVLIYGMIGNNKFLKIDIKNFTYYHFDNRINIKASILEILQ